MSKTERLLLPLILLLALVVLYVGWQFTWFLTDDAFITFRYAANSIKGFGYAWNPPPFRPVEGYSNFLWLVLLDLVWRSFDIAPPDSSTVLRLFFSALSLLLGVAMVWRLKWNARYLPYRLFFVVFFLIGVLGNRTFLTWSSSGLETALFNFTVTLWVFAALFISRNRPLWAGILSLAAALAALTRPDGLLFVLATLFMLEIVVVSRRWKRSPLGTFLLSAAPLLLVPAHLLWRRWFYGEWLPNSFFAKVTDNGLALESGTHYLLSFIAENFLWSWAVIAALVLITTAARALLRRTDGAVKPAQIDRALQLVVLGTLVLHTYYYTFITGGDHFEFRVYSHLILFLFIVLVWMLNRLGGHPALSIGLLAITVILTLPLPWYHWNVSARYDTREETMLLKLPLATIAREEYPALPQPLHDYLEWYDAHQWWLIEHSVGMRQRGHAQFASDELARHDFYPVETDVYTPDGALGIIIARQAGVVSYQNNHLAVLDSFGINDHVVARNPLLREDAQMAHERQPPAGYFECFMGGAEIYFAYVSRQQIIECERRYAAPDDEYWFTVVP